MPVPTAYSQQDFQVRASQSDEPAVTLAADSFSYSSYASDSSSSGAYLGSNAEILRPSSVGASSAALSVGQTRGSPPVGLGIWQ